VIFENMDLKRKFDFIPNHLDWERKAATHRDTRSLLPRNL
jgi:hypothetical protein